MCGFIGIYMNVPMLLHSLFHTLRIVNARNGQFAMKVVPSDDFNCITF